MWILSVIPPNYSDRKWKLFLSTFSNCETFLNKHFDFDIFNIYNYFFIIIIVFKIAILFLALDKTLLERHLKIRFLSVLCWLKQLNKWARRRVPSAGAGASVSSARQFWFETHTFYGLCHNLWMGIRKLATVGGTQKPEGKTANNNVVSVCKCVCVCAGGKCCYCSGCKLIVRLQEQARDSKRKRERANERERLRDWCL